MDEKKVKKSISKRKREALLFIERILVVIIAVCITILFVNSFYYIETPYNTVYHYEVSPFEKKGDFEKSEIFHTLFLGDIEQITRYAVIRNQLEDKGEYQEDKIINITEFANRMGGVPEGEITARYFLDDLITWGNYGFTYKTVVGTWEDLNSLFDDNDVVYTKESNAYLKEYEGTVEENAGVLEKDQEAGNQYAMEILIPRYRTVEGKDLLNCASGIEEYEALKEYLVITAESLFQNYTEYIKYKEIYKKEKTNISYYFQLSKGEETIVHTNSSLLKEDMSADDITSAIRKQGGAFVYFNPDKVQITTNTNITARQMRNILKEYEYTFLENTRVWFWIDQEYLVNDTYQLVKEEIDNFYPVARYLSFVIIVSAAVWLMVVIFVIKKEKAVPNMEEENRKHAKKDTFFLEAAFFLTIMITIFLAYWLNLLWQMFRSGNISSGFLPLCVGSIVFIIHEIVMRFVFSLVRRWKAGQIWKTTFLHYIIKNGKEFIIRTCHNGSIVSRTWIPYLIFLIINLILVLLGIGGVIGAFLIDMLIGIYLYREKKQLEEIVQAIEKIKSEDVSYRIDTRKYFGENLRLASSVNSIGAAIRTAVETSMKDEKLKADLITNVSHDIKTPLTSIISYVGLLKREKITDSKILGYIEVLDNKSQRLKQLIDDLVEVSKISSGNIELHMEKIDFVELVRQAVGEFDEKLAEKQLHTIFKFPKNPMYIMADSSHLWRIMENLMINACKYSLEGTRIYVEMDSEERRGEEYHCFLIKNISEGYLEIGSQELMERFTRGDRSRKTEGSGLGLSIAKNLSEAMGGEFKIEVDGDLFKAYVEFRSI